MVFYIFGGRSIVVVQLVFVAKLSKQILTKARGLGYADPWGLNDNF